MMLAFYSKNLMEIWEPNISWILRRSCLIPSPSCQCKQKLNHRVSYAPLLSSVCQRLPPSSSRRACSQRYVSRIVASFRTFVLITIFDGGLMFERKRFDSYFYVKEIIFTRRAPLLRGEDILVQNIKFIVPDDILRGNPSIQALILQIRVALYFREARSGSTQWKMTR